MDAVTLAMIKALGGGSSQSNKFIVTLTPTALDYSGTMDKTVAEINAAYEAGQEIWFRFPMAANLSYDMPTSTVVITGGYAGFTWNGIANDMIISFAITSLGADDNQYSTVIYSLTPAS